MHINGAPPAIHFHHIQNNRPHIAVPLQRYYTSGALPQLLYTAHRNAVHNVWARVSGRISQRQRLQTTQPVKRMDIFLYCARDIVTVCERASYVIETSDLRCWFCCFVLHSVRIYRLYSLQVRMYAKYTLCCGFGSVLNSSFGSVV